MIPIAMAVLLCASALFSGSEAAMFSLPARSRRRLERAGLGGRAASALLQNPESLLSSILFWNLLVNMVYFALSAMMVARIENPAIAITVSVTSVMAIIFFSEMLPKSLALASPLRTAVWVSPPLSVAVAVVKPALPLIDLANRLAVGLVWPTVPTEPDLDLDDIGRAIDLGTDVALRVRRERAAMRRLVELADVRADDWMRPRTRWQTVSRPVRSAGLVLACDRSDDPLGYVLVCAADDEEVVTDSVAVRLMRPGQLDGTPTLTPTINVPWAARMSAVMDQMTEAYADVAIVRDEFGDWIGAIATEDIFRQVLLPTSSDALGGSVTITGADSYEVDGDFSMRRLFEHLGIDETIEGGMTVAGYVQRFNERLPRIGDTAETSGYRITVVREDPQIRISIGPGNDSPVSNETDFSDDAARPSAATNDGDRAS